MAAVPKQDVTVELFYSGDWHSVPAYTRDPITITRGRGDERARVGFGRCSLTIDNSSGDYNNRLPTSPLYGLIGRNTPLRVRIPTPTMDVTDTFTRTSTNSWGVADSGQTYNLTAPGGSVNDFDVAAGVGTQVVDGAPEFRLADLPEVLATNVNAVVTVGLPTNNVTGGSLEPGNIGVRISNGAYYLFRVEYTTTESLRAQIFSPASVLLADNVAYTSAQWTPGEDIKVRVLADGGTFKMRIWPASVSEPTTWHAEAEDFTYLGPGGVGIRSGTAASNSNVPVTFEYDDFIVETWETLFSGEVPQWTPRWNINGSDVYVPIEATGILRRLNQGARSLRSPMYRKYLSTNPTAWWPLEDPDGTEVADSPISGVAPMQISDAARGLVKFGAVGPPGAGTALDGSRVGLVGEPLTGAVPEVPGATSWRVEWSAMFQTTDTVFTMRMPSWTTTGGVTSWFVRQVEAGGGLLVMYLDAGVGTVAAQSTSTVFNDGQYHLYSVTATQNGANIDVSLSVDGTVVDTGTIAGKTFGVPVAAVADGTLVSSDPVGSGLSHLAFWVPSIAEDTYPAFTGHAGEAATERIERLCDEEGVAFYNVSFSNDAALMGPQVVDTLPNLLQHAADADLGVLYELRSALGLSYRTRVSLYNQSALELDYDAFHIAPPLTPVDDDQALFNDVTVSRPNGGSARAVLESGPLSVQAPPDGVGTYDRGTVTAHLQTDAQLYDHAAWIRHLSTWNEARYPNIALDLEAPVWVADAELSLDAVRLDSGDLVSIDNPPSWLPPDPIVAMVQGYTVRIESHGIKLTLNATPAGPYTVGVLDSSTLGRLDTAGSTITEDLDTTETGVDVTSPGAPWSTTASDFDVVIGGERMTVTSVSGAGPAQTLTVTRSVNGVVKSHTSGASVRLFTPLRLAH